MDCQHLHDFAGLQFMPVKENKQPIIKGWQTSAEKHDLSNCQAVGLVCGKLSGGLEAIDVDEKYSISGCMFDRWKKQVHLSDPGLLAKLVVQQTKSGGFHVLYRCPQISGNLKLANRYTTDEEKAKTYADSYQNALQSSKTEDEARTIASKASKNDKVRVLFETRGEGGFIVICPTNGYKWLYNDPYSLTEISPAERELLHSISRQFNEVVEEIAIRETKALKTKGLSPFDDYNLRGDVVGLLESHGWRQVGQKAKKTVFLRPGQTTAQSSGNYDHEKNWFSVFTTSTEFEPQKAYLPYSVYAILECNGDYTEAAKKLASIGFGEKTEAKKEQPSTRVIPTRVAVNDNDFSCFATPEDYDNYLQQVRDGTLQMGLTTGIPSLDEHFLFKQGNLVMNNGVDNTGKSVVSWYLALLAAMYHGWRGVIFSSENTIGSFMRKMIQFYWGKPLHGNYAMNDIEYRIAKEFIEKHFTIIKAEEELYNYKDIINMVKKAQQRGQYNYAMIDPYNSLKIDLSGYSKLNTHEYHYEAISEIKAHGQKNNFGWWINLHAVTSAARAKDGERKYPLAPRKEDTEGGQKFPNKADDFMTTHRLTQHPTDWMITEVHIRKIKDTETGGRPTSLDTPVKLEMYRGGCAFKERNELSPYQTDPILNWHEQMKQLPQGNLKIPEKTQENILLDQKGYVPYTDLDNDGGIGF